MTTPNGRTSIQLGDCKCGTKLTLKPKRTWSMGRVVVEVASICPESRWYNFWKHHKRTVHMWLPI